MEVYILCVSDEPIAFKNLLHILRQDGYGIDETVTIQKAMQMLERNNYSITLLDLKKANEACVALRQLSDIPIIVFSGNDDDMDEILAIECGADDYIRKPINILKAKVRIKALLRRSNIHYDRKIISSSNSKIIRLGNRSIDLTPKEGILLHMLMERAGHIVSHKELIEAMWGQDSEGQSLKEYIRRLRKKIEPDPYIHKCIISKNGEGYYFNGDYAN